MSNEEYQQRQLFCQEVKMKRPKIKVKPSLFPGLCVGISFPWTDYADMVIGIACVGITFKWRKR